MKTSTVIACALLLCLSLPSGAQSINSKRDRKARLEKDIKVLEGQLSEATRRSNSAATQLELLHAQSEARRELLSDSERELGSVTDSIRVCGIGKEPINQYRQEQLARFLEKAGWRKGYRYTLNAITIPIGRQPGLCFEMRKATEYLPVRNISFY